MSDQRRVGRRDGRERGKTRDRWKSGTRGRDLGDELTLSLRELTGYGWRISIIRRCWFDEIDRWSTRTPIYTVLAPPFESVSKSGGAERMVAHWLRDLLTLVHLSNYRLWKMQK